MLVTYQQGPAKAVIDTAHGARLAELEINGLQLLVPRCDNALQWGCYPMAPWVGRLRNSAFWYGGKVWRVPANFGAHAIHGTTFNKPWRQTGSDRFSVKFDADWPFVGSAHQTIRLAADSLTLTLEVRALEQPFPASIGWHPWFARQLQRGQPAQLSFVAGSQYLVDGELIPTGVLAPPVEGPWDDSFTDLSADPQIHWPGALRLTLSSNVTDWTVYNQLDHALCVEPISGPPNALNIAPVIVPVEQPLTAQMHWQWQLD